ncbi:MAG: hypothetical protein DHS20C17_22110 [Cyclobacteriaceae bacterium]|nr:MAG: hypothetical protein DHS20C17_22110 [Cyclobacteriaceae bacterium]
MLQYSGQLEKEQPVDLVYPMLDAANSRWFYFSSASRPFGLVNLSPDTKIDGAWNSGYVYSKDSIKFFSHIHAWQLSGIPVMPVSTEFKGHLGSDAYQSSYSHEKETVFPGYHSVFLEDYQIKAELTSTTRVGFHKYTFPESDQSHILLDLSTVLGPSGTQSGYTKKIDNHRIEGHALMAPTRRRPKSTYVYFAIETDQPFEAMNAWQAGELLGPVNNFSGSQGGIYLTYTTVADQIIRMKVGVSYVSEEQAWKNMITEIPHWDFDAVVGQSRDHWNEMLGRIEVEGKSEKQIRRFYTDLWKALQGRRIISDVDGKYCDMTGSEKQVGQIPLDDQQKPLFNHYNSDSFWGAQWTITTLWQLVYPEIAEEFVNSMLLMYQDGGLIPRGPSGGNYTYVMTGASSTPFVVGAYAKGIRGFDIEQAYQGLKTNALPGGMMSKAGYEHQTSKGGGIEQYLTLGYVPYPLSSRNWGYHMSGAGQTLEYSFQDWCLAQLAKNLGKSDDYRQFMERSNHWKNIFDAETGWIRPKDSLGNWMNHYDPYELGKGFVESNGAQATWYVPHDLQGLATAMGGSNKAMQKLNESFEEAEKLGFTSGKSHSQETQLLYSRIPINYGNQPSIQTAFVFNHLGYPWLTQYWSRKVTDKVFSGLTPETGYNGDEDQGLMGSLAVLMKMGLFEMTSGCAVEPQIEIGSPIFDKVIIELNQQYFSGDQIIISVLNNGPENYYVNSIAINGQPQQGPFINFHHLVKGAALELVMSDTLKI